MILLACSGKKQSGKDTIGVLLKELLAEHFPSYSFHQIGFADSLYREVANMLRREDKRFQCCTVESIIETIKLDKNKWRTLLQFWGTEYRREQFSQDYWVRQLGQHILKIEEYPNDPAFVYVNDVRFLNEANFCKDAGAILWRAHRPDKVDLIDEHPSECELDSYTAFDQYIINDKGLPELKDQLYLFLKQIINQKKL